MKLSFSKVLMFFGVIISVALINGSARATDVSGVINTNTLWNLDGSPYIVTGGVLVESGGKLISRSTLILTLFLRRAAGEINSYQQDYATGKHKKLN